MSTAATAWQRLESLWLSHRPGRESRWAIAFALIFALTLGIAQATTIVSLKASEVAPVDIIATQKAVDLPLYQAEKAKAARGVAPVYVSSTSAVSVGDSAIAKLIGEVLDVQASLAKGSTSAAQLAAWQSQVGLVLPAYAVSQFLALPAATVSDLGKTADNIYQAVLAQASYKQNQLTAEQAALDQRVAAYALPRAESLFLDAALNQSAQPNLIYSASETQKAISRAQDALIAPMIQPGQLLVAKGEVLSASTVQLLQQLGLVDRGSLWSALWDAALFAAAFALMGAVAISRFRPALWQDRPRLLAVAATSLLTVVVGRLLLPLSPLLLPLPFAAVVVAVLVDAWTALLLTLGLAAILAGAFAVGAAPVAVLIGEAVAGVLVTSRLGDQRDLLRTPLWLGGVAAFLVLAAEVFALQAAPSAIVWSDVLWALAGALVSSLLTLGLLPFFESYFGILSPFRLLEFSNPNQPLLRRLMLEAPGTYHHSLIVSNLAVAAAEAIGADSLLCRVGAYYHDIGKVRRPAFFVDNQMDQRNPHDEISPRASAAIVIRHVQDGLELASHARLPSEISSFIAEHHGTSLVSYFFHKATVAGGEEAADEAEFRYPGPRPQSRETAILMLADSTEAAVRAMPSHQADEIEQMVDKILRDKLEDGQLNESPITLRDIGVIGRTFSRMLAGVYHTRIEYPDLDELRGERRAARGQDSSSARQR